MNRLNSPAQHSTLIFVFALLALSAACNRPISQPAATPAAKRYPFKGRIVSIDKPSSTATINNEPVPGFMDPMVMSYTFKPPATLDQLQPGDSIAADVVVEPDKYWLENVQITGHAKPPDSKPISSIHRAGKNLKRDC
jgi:Cu/Ag efflux protein CusF